LVGIDISGKTCYLSKFTSIGFQKFVYLLGVVPKTVVAIDEK
jgi:hypothetical protein